MGLVELCEDISKVFFDNIKILKERYPELLKIMNMDRNDPHIMAMIQGFILLQASTEQKINYNINNSIRSMLINLYGDLVSSEPPRAILGAITIKQISLQKGMLLRHRHRLYQVSKDINIGPMVIENIQTIKKDNQWWAVIDLTLMHNYKPNTIHIYTHEKIINTIFAENNNVKCQIMNRDLYSTEAELTFSTNVNLKSYLFWQKDSHFFTIQNINYAGIINHLTIHIPLTESVHINKSNFVINCFPIENKFMVMAAPIIARESGEYLIKFDNDEELINIHEVTYNDQPLKHIDQWYLIYRNNLPYIYINEGLDGIINITAQVFNNTLDDNIPTFEEFLPSQLFWEEPLCLPLIYDKLEHINSVLLSIIKYTAFQNITDVTEFIEKMTDFFKLPVKFTNIQRSKYVKPIYHLNYKIPVICENVSMNTDNTNIVLLYHIFQEVNKLFPNTTLDFYIHNYVRRFTSE